MAKKRLTIGKSDGTTSPIDFNIPETQGTYNIKATLENGTVLNAGNIVVNGKANNYKITIGLSNGSLVNAGTFSTPIVYHTASFTDPSYGAWGSSSLSLPYGTTYSVSGNTITFTKPDGSKVTNTAGAILPTAKTLSFGTASYGSWNSTASVSVYDYSFSTPSINATSGTITANTTFSASNSRNNVTFTNSLGGTSGTNATYSGSHTWTISGTTTSGASFSRTFTTTAHNAQYYYVISRNSSATQATSNISFTPSVSRNVHSYTLYYSAKPNGVATHTVYRNGVALAHGATIYYGETLTQSATAAGGYNPPSVNWSSLAVTGNVTATATVGSVKTFELTIPAAPAGVDNVLIRRTPKLAGAAASEIFGLSNTPQYRTIYYGDTLEILSATAINGYNDPTASLSATTVTGNVTASITTGGVKTYTLTIPALPTGVASLSITRTPKFAGAAAAQTFSAIGSTQNKTIYHGDILSISATATSGYNAPTYSLSATTVTGNVTATVKAGSVSVQWRTIFSGSTTITANSESGATTAISGLRANVPTKITFSGRISNNWNFADNAITQRTNAESSNGVYSGSGHQTGYDSSGEFERDYDYGFTLTMQDGSVLFKPYVNGYVYDLCDEQYTIDLSSASVTITNIQQYY